MFFGAASCGDTPEETTVPTMGAVQLPAVWNSQPLDKTPVAIALSEGALGIIGVTYEGSGVQMFDFEGAPLGEAAPLRLQGIERGQTVFFDGARLVVFPALDIDGKLQLVTYGDGLISPIAIPLETGATIAMQGMCAGMAGGAPGSIMQVGYWTAANPNALFYGDVVSTPDGEITFSSSGVLEASGRVTACSFSENGPVVAAGALVLAAEDLALTEEQLSQRLRLNARVVDLEVMTREAQPDRIFARLETGALLVFDGDFDVSSVRISAGISVDIPTRPTSMAAIGSPRGGGYPYGVVALTGQTEAEGKPRITLLDTQRLYPPPAG